MVETVSREGGCCSTLLLSGEERSRCAVGQSQVMSRTEQTAGEAPSVCVRLFFGQTSAAN